MTRPLSLIPGRGGGAWHGPDRLQKGPQASRISWVDVVGRGTCRRKWQAAKKMLCRLVVASAVRTHWSLLSSDAVKVAGRLTNNLQSTQEAAAHSPHQRSQEVRSHHNSAARISLAASSAVQHCWFSSSSCSRWSIFNFCFNPRDLYYRGDKNGNNKTEKCQGLEKTHLFPSCHRDSRIMEPASHWTGARNREMHHCHHRGQQRNHLPVSETVRGSAEGKCGLILRHFPARLVRRCSHFYNF